MGVSGFVLNENLEHLPYATISHPKSESWVIADEEGRFLLQAEVNAGDSLIFHRYGYRKIILISSGEKQMKIFMQRNAIPMDSIEVEGQNFPNTAPWEIIHITETDQMSSHGMFQRIPGSLLKTYGGRAGISNIGMDGGQSEHTKIVLDGIDLTSPQNGQTDLSDIPLAFFQQMFQSRSPGIDYGSGSMDGVIHLSPWFNRSYLNAAIGMFGFKSMSTGYRLTFPNTALQLIGGGFSSDEDYAFSFNDTTYNRDNNGIDQTFFGGRIQYLHSKKTIIKSSLFLTYSDRGVAGSVSFPSLNADRTNTLSLANATLIKLLNSGHISLQVSRRANDEQYSDPDVSINSRHEVSSHRLKMKWNQHFFEHLKAITSLEFYDEKIKSSDIGNRNRSTSAASVSLIYNVTPGFTFRPSIRGDWGESFKATTSDLNVQFDFPILGKINGRIGNGFRLPSFNDMYWPEGDYSIGNQNLNTEKSEYYSIGLERSFFKKGQIKFEWREKNTNNLITWAVGNDYKWSPINLNEVSRNSLNVSFSLPVLFKKLSVSGYLTQTKTKDKLTNKELPYIPEYTGNLMLLFSQANVLLDIQIFYNGKRYYNGYDSSFNLTEIDLDSFTDVTVGIHYRIPMYNNVRLHVTIDNLLDADTSFFPKYPEPDLRVNGGMSIQL